MFLGWSKSLFIFFKEHVHNYLAIAKNYRLILYIYITMISMNSEELGMRASLGYVKNYFETSNNFVNNLQEPLVDYDVLLAMFENDPILTVAFDTTVDVATENGYYFLGKSDERVKQIHDYFNDVLDFDRVISNVLYSMLIYGDAYLEMRMLNNRISELHSLETTEMKIRYDVNGNVEGYIQQPTWVNPQVKGFVYPEWNPDEIIHFTQKRIGSRVYSNNPLKSIYRSYETKKYADNYLGKIFANFPPRLLYNLKNASPQQTKSFVESLKQAKLHPHKDMIALGDVDVKQTGMTTWDSGFTDVLNYLRQEILMITKVPPIWIGIPDNSNRSNSEAQIRSFETRVKAMQHKIESEINKVLMPALGWGKYQFKFKPLSLREDKSILENAKMMKDMGVEKESIEKYLFENGLEVELKEEQELDLNNPNDGDNNPDDDINQGEGGMSTNRLDSNGKSEGSEKKQEQEDSSTRSQLYDYEVDQYAELKKDGKI